MRDFRIRTNRSKKLIEVLKELGFEAEVSKCRPRTNWSNGCSDPECCAQHPEAEIYELEGRKFARMPDTWIAITTNASSNSVHNALLKVMAEKDNG